MPYIRRLIDPLLDQLMAELPAVLIVGPRAAGKTTTARRRAGTFIRLDREAEAAVFRADPDAALRGLEEPVVLDEWQRAGEVFWAVKRAVDDDSRPGRFVLTGSVTAKFDADARAGTGRVVPLTLHGLTVRETAGLADAPRFLQRLVGGEGPRETTNTLDLRSYVELAARGGFPETLTMSDGARRRWLDGYLEQLITRDVVDLGRVRDPARMRRYLSAFAASSAGIVADRTLYDAAGIDFRTAAAYERLLTDLHIVDPIPAWTFDRLKRLVRSPKRYFTDPALMLAVLGASCDAAMRDAGLLGRLLDTFVVAQLRAEADVSDVRIHLLHMRTQQGRHEVDLIAEVDSSRVIALEVKAAAAVGAGDARHLAFLRDQLGDRFLAGVVLHTGPRAFVLGDRITAAPISSLWA